MPPTSAKDIPPPSPVQTTHQAITPEEPRPTLYIIKFTYPTIFHPQIPTPPMNTTSTSHISRYQIDTNSGIQTIRYERHVVGYVEQGTKLIHLGDRYVTVRSGELFHLNPGTHYIENDPAGHDLPFRQTLLFYSPSDLRNDFIPATQIAATNHLCSTCRNTTDIYTYPAWPLIESYFRSLNRLLTTRLHRQRPELGRLKVCELFQLLQTRPGCCISRPMCQALSQSQRTFSDVMHANIFTTASVATLAAQCEMSPTAFKNHCQRTFGTTPHRWIVDQRLNRAQLQLITTPDPISKIARDCLIPNPSHFIKLFRRRFGLTPLAYRRRYEKTGL